MKGLTGEIQIYNADGRVEERLLFAPGEAMVNYRCYFAVLLVASLTASAKAAPAKPFERFDGCVLELDES